MTLEELVSYARRYGFVYPGSEIYGGLANAWDLGPLGALLSENIKKAWFKKFVDEKINCVRLDSPIILNSKVWEASGHLKSFNDPKVDCLYCHNRERADKLVEKASNGTIDADGMSLEDIDKYIKENNVKCPVCGKVNWTPARTFSLMFKTSQGVVEDSKNVVYLRPETAQGIYIAFKNVCRSSRMKLPFGIGQCGKAFRNEITPGNFLFRVREFEQLEMEFFCKPNTEDEFFEGYKKECVEFLKSLGIKDENLKLYDHPKEKLAFYSKGTTDILFKYPWGFDELWGIASRTDYDLTKHQELSGEDLTYLDPETNQRYIPYVVEPSVGVGRLFLAFLLNSYENQVLENGETREVLHIHNVLAPYKAVVLPLIKKVHQEKALEVFKELSKEFNVSYDETQAIGKRYRRADAIGTPYAITIDDDTLNNGIVTVRDRDSMLQEKVEVSKLRDYLRGKLEF
ncbi:MAG: glycine--tRNA ligase [Gammaproteobacteria bacterium]|nr:glycine--tRNA ligase [Gammaproteobacteria bacterium]